MRELADGTLIRTQAYIGGEWVDGPQGATFDVTDPASGELIASVADAREEETEAAVAAARSAFPEWAARTAHDRAQIMMRWHDLMLENAEDLASIMTAEGG